METWSLQHPGIGLIEVERGTDKEFLSRYPDWPQPKITVKRAEEQPPLDAGIIERFKAAYWGVPLRLQVKVNGTPIQRRENVASGRIPLLRPPSDKPVEFSEIAGMVNRKKPHLNIDTSPFKELVRIEYRKGEELVEFDAPAGSRGAKIQEAMHSSNTKRVLYPLLMGMGKSIWFLLVLLIPPLLNFLEWIFTWLFDLFPDVPTIHLPVPHFPDVTVPDIPEIYLPVPELSLPLPDFTLPQLPAWVAFLIEYRRAWLPILLGLIFGILAVRNHKKSEKTKTAWQQIRPGTQPRRNDKRHETEQHLRP